MMNITADELVNDMKLAIVENPFNGNTLDPTYIPRVKHLLTISASVIAGYTFENTPNSEGLPNDRPSQKDSRGEDNLAEEAAKAGSQPPASEGAGGGTDQEDPADQKQRRRPGEGGCQGGGTGPY